MSKTEKAIFIEDCVEKLTQRIREKTWMFEKLVYPEDRDFDKDDFPYHFEDFRMEAQADLIGSENQTYINFCVDVERKDYGSISYFYKFEYFKDNKIFTKVSGWFDYSNYDGEGYDFDTEQGDVTEFKAIQNAIDELIELQREVQSKIDAEIEAEKNKKHFKDVLDSI
ncbi:MAG: hypothetical protein WBB28_05325 [Crinalium sp.]